MAEAINENVDDLVDIKAPEWPTHAHDIKCGEGTQALVGVRMSFRTIL